MALPEMFSSARSLFCHQQQQQQQQGSSLLWPSLDMVDVIGQSCQMQLQRQKSIPNSDNPTLLALHNHCPQGDGDGDGGGGGERRRSLLPLLPNPSPFANGLPTHKRRRENEDNAEAIPPATESNSKTSGSGESEHSSSTKRGRCKPTKPDKSLVSHGNKNSVTMSATVVDEAPKDYVHVRARRGQATDSHSLAERVRREKISERMKFLQDLVPGCSKTIGKAVMLEEIINYVQSLQHQVEFLSMKLAALSPQMDFNIDNLLMREILPAMATANTSTTTNSSNVEQVGRMNEMGFNPAGNVPYHQMMMHQTPLPPHPSAQYGDPPHSLNGCNNSDMPLHFHQSSIPQQFTNTWDLTNMARRREEMDFYGSMAKSASNPE